MTANLTPEQLDAFGAELDALRTRTLADLGQRDVDHIRKIIRLVGYTEAAGRALLHFGIGPFSFLVGTSALGLSKILENMEVGHNVMHGQYDWTKDPALDAKHYEWDTSCTGDDWRHSHNYEHHTFTNVLGKDRDIGYSLLRVTGEQRWLPHHLVQPISALVLCLLFQYGVGLHDVRLDEHRSLRTLRDRARGFLKKAAWQFGRDYAFYPAIAGLNAPRVLAGNVLANLMRNVWTFAVIFCGHFPEGVEVFRTDLDGETRGGWYLRQLTGSANIEGGRTFHVATGHLSHQIEHHLFPDIPASRYPEMAPVVREICARYGLRYVTGTFGRQLGSVAKQIVRHALPDKKQLGSRAHRRSLLTNVQ